ncbi:MAG: hypothetical protein KJS97_00260 [Alphaproteobacteria bacterium]|nr:hypothetical protein [Alphaproteobacteria bacterium]
MRRILALVAAAALAACATATPYQPALKGGYGYAESRIESNRYSLSFSGNTLTERDAVETNLLYRAAELTVQNGYDYFVVVNRAVDPKRQLYTTPSPARYGFAPYWNYYSPRWGWRPLYDPFWTTDTISEVTRYTANAEVVLYKGRKPAEDPNAFDARDVISNLQSKIVQPPAK